MSKLVSVRVLQPQSKKVTAKRRIIFFITPSNPRFSAGSITKIYENHVNNLPDKTLVLAPHRLFSLWDMIEYPAVQTLNIISSGRHHYEVSAGQKSEPDQFPVKKNWRKFGNLLKGFADWRRSSI